MVYFALPLHFFQHMVAPTCTFVKAYLAFIFVPSFSTPFDCTDLVSLTRRLGQPSAMATVIRGAKRPLDLDGMMDALPGTCSSARMSTPEGLGHMQKRQRYAEMMAASAAQAGVPMGSSVRENPFPIMPIEPKELESLVAKSISPRKSNIEGEVEIRTPGLFVRTPGISAAEKDKKGEKTYSHEELTSVVSKVVEQRERALREEYNKLLQAKLAEQFQSFTKFNEDYISRQIKGNPFSYVS